MKKFYCIFATTALCYSLHIVGFQTLSDLQEYAAQYIENPKSDDNAWDDPDFTTYHKSILPSWPRRILRFIGLAPQPLWSIKNFETALNDVVEQRKKAKLSGRLIAHIQLSYPANFVIWGNLEGAFHSLVRDLTWLYQQGIINENLQIIKDDYFLVFYGGVALRSAYILETLTVIMILLYRNPDKIIVMRGNAEDNQAWHDYGLQRELLVRTHSQLTGSIPFESPVNDFFNTLPLAFYISTQKEPYSLVRISTSGRDNSEINEDQCGSFWYNPPRDALHYYDTTQKKESTQKVTVKVIIKSEDWLIETRTVNGYPENQDGLGLLNQDLGSTAWEVLSGPNTSRQVCCNFYYDAFGIITIQPALQDSTIALYNQKISNIVGFKECDPNNLMTGVPAYRATAISQAFKIGSSLGLIGGIPAVSKQIMRGMASRIEEAITNQELKQIYISLITYNDDYSPILARQNINQLIEKDKVEVILLPTGHQTLDSYIDLIREKKCLTLFPVAGSPEFFQPDLQGLINYRVSYNYEISALIDYILSKQGIKKIAFFYQDDAYGRGALKVARNVIKKKGIESLVEIPYARGATEFKQQVDIIHKESPDAIGFFSTAFPTRAFMRQLGTENLISRTLFGLSFLADETIRYFLNQEGITLLFGSVVPNPEKSDLKIVREYRKKMEQQKYPITSFALEAYIGVSILIDALQHVKNPTQQEIKQYLESLHNYDLGGIKLSFNPQTRSLGTKVWIDTGPQEDWVERDISTFK